MMRLSGGDCENLPTQLRFFEPARKGAFEHARPALAEPAPGDHEHAAPAALARCRDEGGERPMRLGLSHPVQIEARRDPVLTAPQPLGGGAVDPGKAIERREPG